MTRQVTDLDAVIASNAVDFVAARVTGPGVHWEPARPADWPAKSYEAPPRCHDGALSGTEYGRLYVVGKLREVARTGWSLWLVRCACGAYEDRTGRAIELRIAPACWRCTLWQRLQRGQHEAPKKRKPRFVPSTTAEVVLSAKQVKRAAGMEPRTALQAALAAALQRSVGGK